MKTKSGKELHPVCLGCMGFGKGKSNLHAWATDDDLGIAIIRKAAEMGMNFFDTAPVYNSGESERVLGKAIEPLNREDLFLATKYYPLSKEEMEAGISVEEHLRKWLEGSLARLNTDYVDLYILHMWDWNNEIDEYLDALQKLIDEGKIRHIGLSNVYGWQLAQAMERARQKGMEPFASVQNQWNLISREDEREVVPYARLNGIVPTPYSSMAAGMLARPKDAVTSRTQQDVYGRRKFSTALEHDEKVIEAVRKTAEKHGAQMSEIALAWLIAKGAMPIAGATKEKQLEGLVRAASVKLDEDDMQLLEEHYVPHVLTGVIIQHTPEQDPYQAYGVDPMGNFD